LFEKNSLLQATETRARIQK